MIDNIKSDKSMIVTEGTLIGSAAGDSVDNGIDINEELIGTLKSPKEITRKLLEYLNSRESKKIAKIVIEEARLYLSKMNLDKALFVDGNLQQLEIGLSDLVEYSYLGEYEKQVSKLKELKILNKNLGNVEHIRIFIESIFIAIEDYVEEQKNSDGEKYDPEELKNAFESSFLMIRVA